MCSRRLSCLGNASSGLQVLMRNAKPLVVGMHYCCLFTMVLLSPLPEVLGLMFAHGKLVEEAMGGMLVTMLLATSILLLFVSGTLIEKALAGLCLLVMVPILSQFVHGLFPVPVGSLLASTASGKNWPPQWQWREQPWALLVFTQGATDPIVGASRTQSNTQLEACGGGCIHLYCSRQEGSEGGE